MNDRRGEIVRPSGSPLDQRSLQTLPDIVLDN